MSVAALIVAAGRGTRVGGAMPKQLQPLGPRPMLQWSVRAFDEHPQVTMMVVVLPAELVGSGAAIVGATARPCRIVEGGARRQDSVSCGLAALPDDIERVLVHDAARPFVSREVIDRVLDTLGPERVAVVPAVPARDTVKRVDRDRQQVTETIPRDEVWLAQTPQGFERRALAAAIDAGRGADVTDEAMLVERAGYAVTVVGGDAANVKITTADDLAAAQRQVAGVARVGTGYDLHRLADGQRLDLAGVRVSTDRGPIAHSDGDVLCHAIIDALLGAAGAGDIGRHFPNTDPAWKNAPGLDLLQRAADVVSHAGFAVANVDATIVLERPKLAGHIDAMQSALAKVLKIDVTRISVKAKTNEGVDAVGRGEAIAAHAVAMLVAR